MLNRLIKEVKEYSKNPVEDIVLHVNEENVTDIRAEISGPGTLLLLLLLLIIIIIIITILSAPFLAPTLHLSLSCVAFLINV